MTAVFEVVAGTVVFLSFVTFALLLSTLRSYVDEEKLREESSVSQSFHSILPPEHLLTAAGKSRAKLAKIMLGILVVSVSAIIVRNQLFHP